MHWIDSETQALLDSLIESLPTARLLLLVNYRPEYQHGWGSKTYYTQLRIDPLPPESAHELLQALLGSDSSLAPLKQLLIERTEGNPFFIEESIRTLVESKLLAGERGNYRLARPIESTQVPATVQAVLAARIDRLPPDEKRLLQSAAVLGKDVRFVLLQAIADQSEEEINRGLVRLQAAEFLYETSLFPEIEYTFKHALTHEVAYGSVLQERRRVLHMQIVKAIERLYPDRLSEHVELLAHHASRGDLWEKAVAYLHEAGRKAAARSAYKEAASYFEQALEALRHLPESHQSLEQGLNVRVDLGPALIAMKGFGAPEVERTYAQARELCQQLGDTPQLFPVLWGLARVHDSRGELNVGRELGEQLLALAQRGKDPALLLEAHHTLWATLANHGDLTSARTHIEQGFALYDPQKHKHHAFLYGGHDPGVCCGAFATPVLWQLGYPEQALRRSQDALSLARQLSHPYSTAHALFWAAWLQYHRGEPEALQALVEESIALASEHGFSQRLAQGNIMRGWLLVEEGDKQAGIAQMLECAAAEEGRRTSVRVNVYYAALLAEAYRKTGQPVEGLKIITKALASVQQQAAFRHYEAELYRIQGELLLSQKTSNDEQAETCFKDALDISCREHAKSLELRAAMSLSRLWYDQGKKAEARQLLADIYGWFTEGFDTADLKAAKALLEELS